MLVIGMPPHHVEPLRPRKAQNAPNIRTRSTTATTAKGLLRDLMITFRMTDVHGQAQPPSVGGFSSIDSSPEPGDLRGRSSAGDENRVNKNNVTSQSVTYAAWRRLRGMLSAVGRITPLYPRHPSRRARRL